MEGGQSEAKRARAEGPLVVKSKRERCVVQQEWTMPQLRKPRSPRPLIERKERMQVMEHGVYVLCMRHADRGTLGLCGSW